MKKIFLLVFVWSSLFLNVSGQREVEQIGEYGFTVGAAHYFGDLNTCGKINRPKQALGIFYKKQFNNYLGIRASAHYAQLGYSDIYGEDDYQRRRNLSFNSDIFELAIQGEFNFFKFIPGDRYYYFTPFVSLGLGAFTFNPYAYLQDKQVYLRPLGTEGQNRNYSDPTTNIKRTPYSNTAICFPIGAGIKYNLSNNVNLSFQITHRLTLTDYLDDVSTTYVGFDKFTVVNGQTSVAGILQDRSYETGIPIGVEGRQRGLSKQKDQFIIAEIGVSFGLSTYKCPSYK